MSEENPLPPPPPYNDVTTITPGPQGDPRHLPPSQTHTTVSEVPAYPTPPQQQQQPPPPPFHIIHPTPTQQPPHTIHPPYPSTQPYYHHPTYAGQPSTHDHGAIGTVDTTHATKDEGGLQQGGPGWTTQPAGPNSPLIPQPDPSNTQIHYTHNLVTVLNEGASGPVWNNSILEAHRLHQVSNPAETAAETAAELNRQNRIKNILCIIICIGTVIAIIATVLIIFL